MLLFFYQPPGTKIFIGNLPDDCDLDRLRSLFETAGDIAEFDVIKNYGFVVSITITYYYYIKMKKGGGGGGGRNGSLHYFSNQYDISRQADNTGLRTPVRQLYL